MKKKMCFLVIILFGILSSCTKKEETPAPQVSSALPEYFFKGTFDGVPFEFVRDVYNYNLEFNVSSSGMFYHNNKNDQYDYNLVGGIQCLEFENKTLTSNEFKRILTIAYNHFVFNVDENYKPLAIDHFNLLKSGLVEYTPYPLSESGSTTNGWRIDVQDTLGNSWISREKNSGNIIINSKIKKYKNGSNYSQINGYIYCKLYNNYNDFKILQGSFSYLVTEYFDGVYTNAYEYTY